MIYYYLKYKKNTLKLNNILKYIKNNLNIDYIDLKNLNNFIRKSQLPNDKFFIILIDSLDENFFNYLKKLASPVVAVFFIISNESSLDIIQNLYTKIYTSSEISKNNLIVDIINFDNLNKNEFYFKLKITLLNLINLFFSIQLDVIKNQELYVIIRNFIKNLSNCSIIDKVFIYSVNPFTKVSNLYYNDDLELSKLEKQKLINIFKNYYIFIKKRRAITF